MSYVFEFGADDLEPAPPMGMVPDRKTDRDLNIKFIGADAVELADIYRLKLDQERLWRRSVDA